MLLLAVAVGAGTRPRVLLDSLISLGAPLALSWYFLLKPLYAGAGQNNLVAAARLAFPVLDLGILFWALVLTHAAVSPARALGLRLLAAGGAALAVTP
jgi:hypothetical protein